MPFQNRFRGGIHPHGQKGRTEHEPIETPPLPPFVVIPLLQYVGAPSHPLVRKGDTVKTGQPVGKATSYVSVPCHASISGTVTSVELRPHPLGIEVPSVVITSDGQDLPYQPFSEPKDWTSLPDDTLIQRIQDAGLAGMGGAGFPSHVKLSPPPEKKITTVLLNGTECEPYLTADHRVMVEYPDNVLTGLRIIMKILKASKAFVCIEKNKPDAILILSKKTAQDPNIRVVALPVKYPQGAENQLIQAVVGQEVPSAGLPMDVGCLVHNVATALALYEAVSMRKPLIDRIVTVTGPGIARAKNLRVRIGTPVRHCVEFCGGYTDTAIRLIHGGPMTGISQFTDEIPIVKGSSGIVVLDQRSSRFPPEEPCIRCARCVDVCPIHLLPNEITQRIIARQIDKALRLGILDCIECGCCGFICPAKRNLVHNLKLGKVLWAQRNDPTQSAAA